MSDNIRIRTTPGNSPSSINVKVNQKFDFIEILSLKISQDEAYRRFCSDYGAVVGRVIVNNGVGVPNAKVSIFIPIDDEDALDPETLGLYPFEIVTGKDHSGIGYNLLPRNSRGKGECFTPIGTFPSKREIQDNPEMGYIYCKYYKFTTTTNDSGDFMIFGVPVGSHFLHVDVDVSDIGILSQKPYELIEEGASEKSFASPTKYKGRDETINLNQLKTMSPISVDVVPFWGDLEECEVGISRVDVDLKTKINPTALFMGSLFSDSEKNSINKRCRPRKKMGKHSELVTGPGRIEMIRKTLSGRIERHDVKGGEVIDDNGTWAYLIPMNLDYMVTSEDGTMIPSDDPKKGIPTRANVRFRIGMNDTGAEGRLRSRAKYLVPNNPVNKNAVDYDFDESTNPESFANFYWNKIYTVKNHITRVQPNKSVENRNFIGIKDVDEGQSTPFPFNRMDNDINPLFGAVCTILTIILSLICVINGILIPLINLVLFIVNVILSALCLTLASIMLIVCALKYALCVNNCTNKRKNCRCDNCMNTDCTDGDCHSACLNNDIVPYIPYITLGCTADPDGMKYAPCGWKSSIPPIKETWEATHDTIQEPTQSGNFGSVNPITGVLSTPPTYNNFHYPGDQHGHGPDAGWLECQALALAESLNVFKFDFYNDWVNGTLYSFLLKVKIKKRGEGKMKFCETDCEDDDLGVDNDENNNPDNKCRTNFILDSCTNSQPDPHEMNSVRNPYGVDAKVYKKIKEGYIKRYKDEFYYSAISKKSGNKLFATDIVSLGSMVDCDWQGVPNIHKYFIDTTYNRPPLVAEYDDSNNPNQPNSLSLIDTTGFDTKLNGTTDRLIGNVFCLPVAPGPGYGVAGILTDSINCINIRRFSELGTGLDEDRSDDTPNDFVDNRITNNDVENPFIRGAFAYVNSINLTSIPLVYFDLAIPPYAKPLNPIFGTDTELNYSNFRNRKILNHLKEHDNSFYFYFGLIPGNSALTKMNRNFFTECVPFDDSDFFIVGTVDAEDDELSGGTGQLTINILNGSGPYQIQWEGPVINGTPFTHNSVNYPSDTQTLSNLYVGTYNVTVVDSSGNIADGTFYVPGPQPTTCDIQTAPASINGASDGQIHVSVSGGQNPYTVDVYFSDPNLSGFTTNPTYSATITSNSTTFTNVPAGDYYVEVVDSGTPSTQCSETIEVEQPSILNVSISGNPVTCYGEANGVAYSVITGGDAPYTIVWTSSVFGYPTQTTSAIGNLVPGVYTASVTDANGQTGGGSYTVTQPQDLTYNLSRTTVTSNGSDGTITVSNVYSEGNVEITLDNDSVIVGSNGSHTFSNLDIGTYILTLRDIITDCTKVQVLNMDGPPSPLVVTGVDRVGSVFTVTASGSWGNFPSISNPYPSNEYEYIWEKSSDGGVTWISFGNFTNTTNTYNTATGVGKSEVEVDIFTQPNPGNLIKCKVQVDNQNDGNYEIAFATIYTA
jgi:hypothetical protein